jgi:hypothetical protein
MSTNVDDVVEQLRTQRELLLDQLAEKEREARAIDDEIARVEAAITTLLDKSRGRRRNGGRSNTAMVAILAAHATFNGTPVHSSTLFDHDDLVHYSRHTLRSALAELHRSGQLTPKSRAPKGYIW